MKQRICWWVAGCALALVLSLSIAGRSVQAGGWAVATLDELPTNVVAGEAVSIGFMVRQHGKTPLAGLKPRITATNARLGKTITASAVESGAVGHYVVELTFPGGGAWRWWFEAFGPVQPMPDLAVGTVAGRPDAPIAGWRWLPVTIGVVGLLAMLGALLYATRTRARYAPALVVVAFAVAVLGLSQTAIRPARSAAPTVDGNMASLGQALFLAKGCVMCHSHSAIAGGANGSVSLNIGPVLSSEVFSADYLRLWLKDPAAVKPSTEMPNLGLDEAEIEALVAFLSADATP